MSKDSNQADSFLSQAHDAPTGSDLEKFYLASAQVSAILAVADALDGIRAAMEEK